MPVLRFCVLLILLLWPAPATAEGMARLSYLEGGVQVLVQDTTDWTNALINIPLASGDRLWVPENGRAEVQLTGGVFARANGSTAFDMLTLRGDAAQFYVDRGRLYINNLRGGIAVVQVDTPLTSIRSYDNSVLLVDVAEDGVTEVSVLKGYATAESREGATRVAAGSALTMKSVDVAEMAPISAADDWERWNTDRDREVLAWGESARYLPDELHEYSGDLDRNGRWEYASGYGYVWLPVSVAADWAPYTYGSWVWIRGNYVWIAYDPWCWAPCHYGRWIYVAGLGWCWVPPAAGTVAWGPGYVGWIVTTTYVAWVPLAPGEIYYGYGIYGPASVNITTVTVSPEIRHRRLVNADRRNAVTVVERESFGSGKSRPYRSGGNPFLTERRTDERDIAVVPPPTRPRQPAVFTSPEQEERRPRLRPGGDRIIRNMPEQPEARPIPRERNQDRGAVTQPQQLPQPGPSRPPERVRSVRPEQMMKERQLVRERNASVFRQHPPANLPVIQLKEPRSVTKKPGEQKGHPEKEGEQKKERRDDQRRP
ncbi:MAG: hypothetical protein M0042_00150 [Nitrospiraceae bacterium]|nr:hypothetical protein [Nitrospiraceae bacterium]